MIARGVDDRDTGELIVNAIDAGVRGASSWVCGGSATTDGGSAPCARRTRCRAYRGIQIIVACDVRTTFVDAAASAPQKV